MDLGQAILGRRTVRSYARTPVDQAAILSLIDAAIQAPSAMNAQPWAFAVVRDPMLLNRISAHAKVHAMEQLPAGKSNDSLRARLAEPEFHILHHAPVLIVICARQAGPWMVEDCALAAQNLMLAAYGAGLGSCWAGFAQGYLQTPAGKAALGVPEPWVPAAPIVVGYPAAMPAPVPRRPSIVRWVG